MTFEFLIACHITNETDIRQTLTGLLTGILEARQNSFNEGLLADMVLIRHRRPITGEPDGDGANGQPTLIGFTVELPDDTRDADDVTADFANALPDTPPISHVVKFEDPLLEAYLAERASEIFALEMKLRRVLSLVYLNAYQLEDPLNLLREERRDNQPRHRPEISHMRAATENQFFHLLFEQYAALNQRQQPDLSNLLNYIRSLGDYDALHAEVSRRPIEDGEDADFIAGLEEIMDPIERMRNCVAHNRRPSRSIRDNYPNARDQLEDKLNEYLSRWSVQE